MNMQAKDEKEIIMSNHNKMQWHRRGEELLLWIDRDKKRKQAKITKLFGNIHVDLQLYPALTILKQKDIMTEFSCAGVSPLDEPEDHSLYAYLTLIASEQAARFVQLTMNRMKHRVLVSLEPERNRYDLSSFYIGHNRSFCRLLQECAERFE
ncbi:hypothetical protein GC096_33085 [Paenibacillus sp. LMG 31461]|uniref:Uncharacterized protein n=2 Tax=Paenibacillus plantarum TaxID=2654975 RepID=A0ABX1XLX6_9BACL|nr:hypothetical protein [Paenibacillus plantarum]